MKSAFHVKLQGFPPANRDARVLLTHTGTGQTVERKVFLDGSLVVRDLDPGMWEMEVRHPNLIMPIDKRKIRLFPTPLPTFVPVPVPPSLFRDTPIRDVPDADLGPVQQQLTAIRDRAGAAGGKGAGDLIRAEDWNALAAGVSDLANAVLELIHLVAPRGHDHPEIAEKIAEVQGNVRRFIESFGRTVLELRREIQASKLRDDVDVALAPAPADIRADILRTIGDLEIETQTDSTRYSAKLAAAGFKILEALNTAAAQPEAPDDYFEQPPVAALLAVARNFANAGTQADAESELAVHAGASAARKGFFGVRG